MIQIQIQIHSSPYMPFTRRQKAKARKSREMDILSVNGNMDIMLGNWNSNSLERELDNVITCADRHQEFESLHNRGSSSQDNEIRDLDSRNGPVWQDGLAESIEILSSEKNARISQQMDSLINLKANANQYGY